MRGERERQLFLLLITGIVIVIMVTVLLIISVWNRKEDLDNEQKEYKLGQLNINKNISYEDYAKKYFGKIEKLLLEQNYDSLFNYIGKDYIEYSGLTVESLKDYLMNKKIVGQALELKAYETVQIEGYSNIYVMNIKLKDGIYDVNIVVREISPNDFSITLEEYIKGEESNYNSTMNGVNLEVKNIVYFSNYIEYELVIKNTHDNDIVLNTNKAVENIYLKLANNSLVSPYNTVLGGREINIGKDRIKEYKIKYNVSNKNINYIKSIVIKDIYYEGREVTSDVEFVLN